MRIDKLVQSYERGLAYLFIKIGLLEKSRVPFSDFVVGEDLVKLLNIRTKKWDRTTVYSLISQFYARRELFKDTPGFKIELEDPDNVSQKLEKYMKTLDWYSENREN